KKSLNLPLFAVGISSVVNLDISSILLPFPVPYVVILNPHNKKANPVKPY
ncbi:hypothetical protein J2S13_003301, partial [Oikeobacillus pervagus]|nr:hypothetical protein [Oikeobacillus pervagus]